MHEIKILYEDDELLVVDKPVGLVVDDSSSKRGSTLQDWLRLRYAAEFVSGDTFAQRCGVVHRLDKDTSGVLAIAKTRGAFENLQRQFEQKEVVKEYEAVVHGEIADDVLEIDVPLGRAAVGRARKFGVVRGGREAFTRIEKVKTVDRNGESLTMVRVFPKTGRTHQIRVHLAAINHPVAGDLLYAGKKRGEFGREIFGRMMLHAKRISFKHPTTAADVTFVSSDSL